MEKIPENLSGFYQYFLKPTLFSYILIIVIGILNFERVILFESLL